MNVNYEIYSEKRYDSKKEAKFQVRDLAGPGYVIVKQIWDSRCFRLKESIISMKPPRQRICKSERIFTSLGFQNIQINADVDRRICKSPRIDFRTLQIID